MKDREKEILMHAASEFINRESNRRSMITVTNIDMQNRSKRAIIFVSVFPEKDTHAATDFLNRKKTEFRDYIKKNTRLRTLPIIEFLPSPVIGGVIEEHEQA